MEPLSNNLTIKIKVIHQVVKTKVKKNKIQMMRVVLAKVLAEARVNVDQRMM